MESEPTNGRSRKEYYEDLVYEVTKMRTKYPAACASYLSSYLKTDADTRIKAEVVSNKNFKKLNQSEFLDDSKWKKLNLHKELKPCEVKVARLEQEISEVREVLAQIKSTQHRYLQQ